MARRPAPRRPVPERADTRARRRLPGRPVPDRRADAGRAPGPAPRLSAATVRCAAAAAAALPAGHSPLRRAAAGLDRRRGDAARRRAAARAGRLPGLVLPARPGRGRCAAGRRADRPGLLAAPPGERPDRRRRAGRHRLRDASPGAGRGHRDLRLPAAGARAVAGPTGGRGWPRAGRSVAQPAAGRGRGGRRRAAGARPGHRVVAGRAGAGAAGRGAAGAAASALAGA